MSKTVFSSLISELIFKVKMCTLLLVFPCTTGYVQVTYISPFL